MPLTGLSQSTAYTVTLQAICGAGGTTASFTRTFTTMPPPPANNECATAISLTPSALGGACVPTSGTVVSATQSNPAILCAGFTAASAQDVWYSFVATAPTHTINIVSNFDGVLEVLSGACGATTNITCSDEQTTNNETLTLTTLTVGTTYRLRYYPYTANPVNGTFTICVTTPTPIVAIDAAAVAVYSVGKAPVRASQVVRVVVRNAGTTALTNVPVILTVTGANTFTDAKLVPALAVGASATVAFATYAPANTGSNTLTVTVSAPNDGVAVNNTQTFPQLVTANTISYLDDGQPVTAAVGVSSTTPGGTLATKYVINSAATIGEVKLSFLASSTTTSTYQVVVLDATSAGLPNTILFTSPTLSRPTAAGVVTVPITNTPVNGTFFVGLREVSGNVAIGY